MATTPKSRPTNRAKPAASKARPASATRSRAASAKPTPAPSPPEAAGNGSNLRGPLVAGGLALAGIVGGVVLGAKARPRKRRLPSVNGLDLKKLGAKKTRTQVGRASRQFGEFTRELRKAGEQAERLGDALS
jgi:hypothetical protein